MRIILQEESEKQGNDCIIENCIVIMECHGKYIAANFRRYIGWCDRGIDVRHLKTFDTEPEALKHFEMIQDFDC
jgi:hypothetical protein